MAAAPWTTVVDSDTYKSATPADRLAIKQDYFDRVIKPEVAEGDQDKVQADFMSRNMDKDYAGLDFKTAKAANAVKAGISNGTMNPAQALDALKRVIKLPAPEHFLSSDYTIPDYKPSIDEAIRSDIVSGFHRGAAAFDMQAAGLASIFGDDKSEANILDQAEEQRRMAEEQALPANAQMGMAAKVGQLATGVAIPTGGYSAIGEAQQRVAEAGGTPLQQGMAGVIAGVKQYALAKVVGAAGAAAPKVFGSTALGTGGNIATRTAGRVALAAPATAAAGTAMTAATNPLMPKGAEQPINTQSALEEAGTGAFALIPENGKGAKTPLERQPFSAVKSQLRRVAGDNAFLTPSGEKISPSDWTKATADQRLKWLTQLDVTPEEEQAPAPSAEQAPTHPEDAEIDRLKSARAGAESDVAKSVYDKQIQQQETIKKKRLDAEAKQKEIDQLHVEASKAADAGDLTSRKMLLDAADKLGAATPKEGDEGIEVSSAAPERAEAEQIEPAHEQPISTAGIEVTEHTPEQVEAAHADAQANVATLPDGSKPAPVKRLPVDATHDIPLTGSLNKERTVAFVDRSLPRFAIADEDGNIIRADNGRKQRDGSRVPRVGPGEVAIDTHDAVAQAHEAPEGQRLNGGEDYNQAHGNSRRGATKYESDYVKSRYGVDPKGWQKWINRWAEEHQKKAEAGQLTKIPHGELDTAQYVDGNEKFLDPNYKGDSNAEEVRSDQRQDGGAGQVGKGSEEIGRSDLQQSAKAGAKAGDEEESVAPRFTRAKGKAKGTEKRLSKDDVQSLVDKIKARWKNAPEIMVHDSISSSTVPKAIRDRDAAERAVNPNQGATQGVHWNGKVHIFADGNLDARTLSRTVAHEALGHYGLHGFFGKGIETALDQIAKLRPGAVKQIAKSRGLDITKPADHRMAAEELLTKMAEEQPSFGPVKRAIADIRTWLRDRGIGESFGNRYSDLEILRDYIIPAKKFVTEGRGVAGSAMKPAFSRGVEIPRISPTLQKGVNLFNALKEKGYTLSDIGNEDSVVHKDGKEVDYEDLPPDVQQLTNELYENWEALKDKGESPKEIEKEAINQTSKVAANQPAFSRADQIAETSIKAEQVEKERQSRFLPKLDETAKRAWGKIWSDTALRSPEDYQKQLALVDELKNNSRPLSDVEAATLLRHQVGLQNDYGDLLAKFKASKSSGQDTSWLVPRMAALRSQLSDFYNIVKRSKAETARGLAAFNMVAKEDFSLANMKERYRVAKGVDELSAADEEHIDKLHKRIEAVETALNAHRSALSDAFNKSDNKTKFLAERIRDFAWADKDPYRALAEMPEADPAAIQRAWKSVQTKMPGLELENFDPEKLKSAQPKSEYTEEAAKLQSNLDDARIGFLRAEDDAAKGPESISHMLIDLAGRYRIASVISSPLVYGKLLCAAASRTAITPAEELVGEGLHRASKHIGWLGAIASKAPRHGSGSSLDIETQALQSMFDPKQAGKDIAETLRYGKSPIEQIYKGDEFQQTGYQNILDLLDEEKRKEMNGGEDMTRPVRALRMMGAVLNMVGVSHSALKAPVMRAEFVRAEAQYLKAAQLQGLDPTDLHTRLAIREKAYEQSLGAIFRQKNKFVDEYQSRLNKLMESDDPVDKIKALGRKVIFPVVRIPSNIVAETAEYLLGPAAHAKIISKLIREGTEGLKENEAEAFMRSLKKGTLGIPAWIGLGYMMAQNMGGLWRPGHKQDPDKPKYGAIRIGNTDIPPQALHGPLFNAIMFGATLHEAKDETGSDEMPAGWGNGTFEASLGLATEIPFVDEMTQLDKVANPQTRGKWLNDFAASIVMPQAATFLAKYYDKDAQGNTVMRDPKGFLQTLQASVPGHGFAGIPGREDLPEK
jgi:hypothetical protein